MKNEMNKVMEKLDGYMNSVIREIEFCEKEIENIETHFKKQIKDVDVKHLSVLSAIKKAQDAQSDIKVFQERIKLDKEEIEYMNYLSTIHESCYRAELTAIENRINELKKEIETNLGCQKAIIKMGLLKSMISSLELRIDKENELSYECKALLRKKDILYKVMS